MLRHMSCARSAIITCATEYSINRVLHVAVAIIWIAGVHDIGINGVPLEGGHSVNSFVLCACVAQAPMYGAYVHLPLNWNPIHLYSQAACKYYNLELNLQEGDNLLVVHKWGKNKTRLRKVEPRRTRMDVVSFLKQLHNRPNLLSACLVERTELQAQHSL